jgi:hypothetical protein
VYFIQLQNSIYSMPKNKMLHRTSKYFVKMNEKKYYFSSPPSHIIIDGLYQSSYYGNQCQILLPIGEKIVSRREKVANLSEFSSRVLLLLHQNNVQYRFLYCCVQEKSLIYSKIAIESEGRWKRWLACVYTMNEINLY